MNTKHDDKKVFDLCNKRFESAEEIVNHTLSLHTVETQDCELCGFKYTTDVNMLVHMISKHILKICHICEKALSNTEQPKKHFEQNHVNPGPGSTCSIQPLS